MKPKLFVGALLSLLATSLLAAESAPPTPIRAVPPKFPPEMRRTGTSGVVTLNFLVTEKGEVQDPTVQKTTDAAFVPNALDAIRKWKFKPATKDGAPVAVRVSIPIKFDVEDEA